MEYKFTFEDGSEALAHHGVKGMKWGVRNAETLAKYGLSGVGKSIEGGGGGGGIVIEDEDDTEELDAEEYGMKDNSVESQDAVYGELGLNRDMSREEALDVVRKSFVENWNAYSSGQKRSPIELTRALIQYSRDVHVANTLPKTRIDATKFGMKDNSGASQEAAYGEAGLNRRMTRSEAQAIVKKDFDGADMSNKNTREAYNKSMELANSLPVRKKSK